MFLKPRIVNNRFSDIKMGFQKNPYTKDIARVYDENAIKQSVVNLVLTKQGEIPFKPWKGTKIHGLLFENYSPVIEHEITKEVEYVLEQEPRIRLIGVESSFDEMKQTYFIKIKFVIINTDRETSTTIPLKRVR